MVGPPTFLRLIHFSNETEAFFWAEIIDVIKRDKHKTISFINIVLGCYKCNEINSKIFYGRLVVVLLSLPICQEYSGWGYPCNIWLRGILDYWIFATSIFNAATIKQTYRVLISWQFSQSLPRYNKTKGCSTVFRRPYANFRVWPWTQDKVPFLKRDCLCNTCPEIGKATNRITDA